MRVILDEQGYVQEYAIIGEFGCPSLVVEEPDDLVDFENNYQSYYLTNDDHLVKDCDRQSEIEDKNAINELRAKREHDCFPYVNRGYLWHNKLTELQKAELNDWYQEWLDVTETRTIPEMPEWLK